MKEYELTEKGITKDGHLMFSEDIIKELNSIEIIKHQRNLKIREIVEQKNILDKLNLKDILEKHQEVIEDYIYLRGVKAHYPNSIEEHIDFMREKIIHFGYGIEEFHTADVELLLQIAIIFKELEELYGKLKEKKQLQKEIGGTE